MTRAEYIRQLVDAAPPFSAETRAQLYVLLAPARASLAARRTATSPRRRISAA